MAELQIRDIGALNTYINPLNTEDGNVIHCVNLDSNPLGGKSKRTGYQQFLGTSGGGTVNNLFDWQLNNGTAFYIYKAAGSVIQYSFQGTGAWTTAGNGTIPNGAYVAHGVLDNTLVIGDTTGTMRTTTNGTTFSNITDPAPVGVVDILEYQGRIYAEGTASSVFYSTTGTATDWTTDSSSLFIPGGGKLTSQFKASDRLIFTKNSGLMYRWDGASLVDMATALGPTSKQSMASIEDYSFWINRLGLFISNAGKPQLISNTVQRQFYNSNSTGISWSSNPNTPSVAHRYDYLSAIGTITDDLSGVQITNAILKYNYQKNEFVNYKFANFPTAWCSYKDTNGDQQLIFGDSTGQVYQMGTVQSDNTVAIDCALQLVLHAGMPFLNKEWGYLEVMTNPGCQAMLSIAIEDTFTVGKKRWIEMGSLKNGFNQFRFPSGSRGKLLFINIYESSSSAPFEIYGINCTYNLVPR